VASFSSRESKEKDINSDYKIPTVPRVTIGRLFSKKVSSLKLSATFPASVLERIASTIS